jgi:hypothetical protein
VKQNHFSPIALFYLDLNMLDRLPFLRFIVLDVSIIFWQHAIVTPKGLGLEQQWKISFKRACGSAM